MIRSDEPGVTNGSHSLDEILAGRLIDRAKLEAAGALASLQPAMGR